MKSRLLKLTRYNLLKWSRFAPISPIVGPFFQPCSRKSQNVQALALALFVNKLDIEDPSFINCKWSQRVVSILKKGPRPMRTFSTHVKKSMECSYSLDQVPFDSTEFEDHLNTLAWLIDPYIFRETDS